jgi:hypothetical protein
MRKKQKRFSSLGLVKLQGEGRLSAQGRPGLPPATCKGQSQVPLLTPVKAEPKELNRDLQELRSGPQSPQKSTGPSTLSYSNQESQTATMRVLLRLPKNSMGGVQWYTPVQPALRRLEQED